MIVVTCNNTTLYNYSETSNLNTRTCTQQSRSSYISLL